MSIFKTYHSRGNKLNFMFNVQNRVYKASIYNDNEINNSKKDQ